MTITEDQFIEIVAGAINRHVSRDQGVSAQDQEWESRNAAKSISGSLRANSVPFIPAIEP